MLYLRDPRVFSLMKNDDQHTSEHWASTLAANLVTAREAAGFTQTELAVKAGSSRATVAQIESGRGDPRLSTLSALATALGVNTSILLFSDDDLHRLVELASQSNGVEDFKLSQDKKELLTQLSESRVTAERRKAARLSADFVVDKGYTGLGAAVGAAIGTGLLPGIGTVIGAFLGVRREG